MKLGFRGELESNNNVSGRKRKQTKEMEKKRKRG
jgi:hypothetical protein